MLWDWIAGTTAKAFPLHDTPQLHAERNMGPRSSARSDPEVWGQGCTEHLLRCSPAPKPKKYKLKKFTNAPCLPKANNWVLLLYDIGTLSSQKTHFSLFLLFLCSKLNWHWSQVEIKFLLSCNERTVCLGKSLFGRVNVSYWV